MTSTTNDVNLETLTQYEKYKQYRKEWAKNNRLKINSYAKQQYIKKVQSDPAYRDVCNERVTKRNHLKTALLDEKPKRGRPRKEIVEELPKNPNGRPKKY
jgi:hypothetical protein